MSKINRRSFLKRVAAGAVVGVATPQVLMADALGADSKSGMDKLEPLYFDVAIVGAGAAGCPAAIAAAREGARVVLLEDDMVPGGAPVDQYVTFICGAPRVGLFQKMVSELNRNHTLSGEPISSFGADGMDGKNHWWHPTSYLQVITDMLAEYPNITLMCGSMVVDVVVERGVVRGVKIIRSGVMQQINARVTIDATGLGLVSEKAGCRMMYGRDSKSDFNENLGLEKSDGRTQPCTWMFISQRLRKDAVIPRELLKGGVVEDNLNKWIMKDDRDETARRNAGIYLHWGKSIHCEDTRDPLKLAQAQAECLRRLEPEIKALNEAGFSCNLAPKLGVRECRRIVGEYVLPVNDIQKGLMPEDKIAEAWYNLDPWGMRLTTEQKDVPPYGIPYRCLIPKGVEGLLAAGRIISGTHIAASSFRVQPICSNIGEAAGTAAAMAALSNSSVRDVDIKKLQRKLAGYGLFDFTKKRGY